MVFNEVKNGSTYLKYSVALTVGCCDSCCGILSNFVVIFPADFRCILPDPVVSSIAMTFNA